MRGGGPRGGAAAAAPPVRGGAEVGRGASRDRAVVRGGARQEPGQGPAGEAHGPHQPSQHAGWLVVGVVGGGRVVVVAAAMLSLLFFSLQVVVVVGVWVLLLLLLLLICLSRLALMFVQVS